MVSVHANDCHESGMSKVHCVGKNPPVFLDQHTALRYPHFAQSTYATSHGSALNGLHFLIRTLNLTVAEVTCSREHLNTRRAHTHV